MLKNIFKKTAALLITLASGLFLFSACSGFDEIETGYKESEISFSVSYENEDAVSTAKTALPEINLEQYSYLYTYKLSLADENSQGPSDAQILFEGSYTDFRAFKKKLRTGVKYKFEIDAFEGDIKCFHGVSEVILSDKPTHSVNLILVPCKNSFGNAKISWTVPDDGVITKLEAGLSSVRGRAAFTEIPLSTIPGEGKKKAENIFTNVPSGIEQWIDYKFYDAQGIVVFEGSESLYIVGSMAGDEKESESNIEITAANYYRAASKIAVKKDGALWTDPEIELKLVTKDNSGNAKEYFLSSNGDGTFSGILPGVPDVLNGKYDIYAGKGDRYNGVAPAFVKTASVFDVATGKVDGTGSVEIVTVAAEDDCITPTALDGIISKLKTADGKPAVIVPKDMNFKFHFDVNRGYEKKGTVSANGVNADSSNNVTLKASGSVLTGVVFAGIDLINYNIVYKSKGELLSWDNGFEPRRTFTIKDDFVLPAEENFHPQHQVADKKIDGWWYGDESNIIHKISAGGNYDSGITEVDGKKTLTLNVRWIDEDDTEYQVNYLFENLDGSYSENTDLIRSKQFVGRVGTLTNVTAPDFSSSGYGTPSFANTTILANNGTVIDVKYPRKSITLTFNGNGGKWGENITETRTGKYGANVAAVSDPVKAGYRFTGWKENTTVHQTAPLTFPVSDITYEAQWELANAAYKIAYYEENPDSVDGNRTYTRIDSKTENMTGKIGEVPYYDEKVPEAGFEYSHTEFTYPTILADGSTEVRMYFNRKVVVLTFEGNGGTWGTETHKNVSGKFGTNVGTVENPVRSGNEDWVFAGWKVSGVSKAVPATFPAESEIYTAQWTQTNGEYYVTTYVEDVYGKLEDIGSVEKWGPVGSRTSETAEPKTGFDVTVDQVNISADEAKEVKVTYTRKNVTVTFNANGGNWINGETGVRTGKYGTELNSPAHKSDETIYLERDGFIFLGWSESAGSRTLVSSLPSHFEENKTFYAVWDVEMSGTITNRPDVDVTLEASVSGKTINASVTIPYASSNWSYAWYVNGVKQLQTTKQVSLTVTEAKVYSITVIAKDTVNGKTNTYTATKDVKVE